MDYLSLADRNWPLLRRLMGGHTAVYRASDGLIGHRVPGAPPMLLLDHVGAKSGDEAHEPARLRPRRREPRARRLQGRLSEEPGVVSQPARATPTRRVQVGSRTRNVHARVAEGEERERLWTLMVGVYGGYEGYRKRTEREIPLVVLEPR